MINWPAFWLAVAICFVLECVFDVIKLPEFLRIVIGLVLVVLMSDFIFKAVS
ncbi:MULTISPECIES: hypothetical protein [Vibrio]|nr:MULTISPECIES: hypothetical protein [Vibrio]MCF7455698.1 hypothetical protein [Vibrio sp. A1-1]MCZ6338172.1 hypothetical protein [Vibrio parahaemolyticus]MCZ6357949.1 hypothetical protein [Vibrio parahaemolyticus]HCE3464635.1 hypothetical protein [Vibrio parahaemolyticus]